MNEMDCNLATCADKPLQQLLILVLLIISGPASLAEIVKTRIVAHAEVPESGYETSELAVVAASNRYNPDSVKKNREHVGGIIRCQERGYFYTHGKGRRGKAPVHFSVLIPKGCTLDSFWHTHGGNYEYRRLFSPSDTHTANTTGKPMYMADYEGSLRVFRPGDALIRDRRIRGSLARYPKGSSAGNLISKIDGEPVRIANR